MNLYLVLLQCPACLVNFTGMVFEISGKWLYSISLTLCFLVSIFLPFIHCTTNFLTSPCLFDFIISLTLSLLYSLSHRHTYTLTLSISVSFSFPFFSFPFPFLLILILSSFFSINRKVCTYVFGKGLDVIHMGLNFFSSRFDDFLEEIMQVVEFSVEVANDLHDGVVDLAQDVGKVTFLDQFVADLKLKQ